MDVPVNFIGIPVGLACFAVLATLQLIPHYTMEALSQLDVQNPDHVSVITRDGKVTISVVKDGTSVTLGFPIKTSLSPITPPPATAAVVTKQVTGDSTRPKPIGAPGSKHVRFSGYTPKLTPSNVRDIKMLVEDPDIMSKYPNKTRAYEEIGKAYNVTGCAIGNIARGIAWRHITV